ncbi:phosphoribosyltransferase [Sandaracinobacteroides saxicola]|uniref:Phosphoribosyltransferase n=1 Tax=Sandaracinobacteroides saxicola TaxID=2759707 RepID=A0A7G5IHX8_9SPHN|nr:phosphoribosyltransferase [Sandaracinobacteroides saxicola]QMW22970.1 phosphoribosyltransferase [Sandaracinobacteroides saxicola]
MTDLPPRRPWPPNFPDVLVLAAQQDRDAHPSYLKAKTGSAGDALRLILDLVTSDADLAAIPEHFRGRRPTVVPVVADENVLVNDSADFNTIPPTLALFVGMNADLPVQFDRVVQTNKVGHTRAPAFQRIVTPARFAGALVAGMDYLLVDDHVGMGGTLASLRGYVEHMGGTVVGMICLTASPGSAKIALQSDTLDMIRQKHGPALDSFWQTEFGYGLDCLTNREAQHLCRQPSVDAIKDLLAKAAVEARGRGLAAAVG